MVHAADIVTYWQELGGEKWFVRDDAVDEDVRDRFGDLIGAAAGGDLDDWAGTPEGALALVLILDQFPRNVFRGSARAFAYDDIAREVADAAIKAGHDGGYDVPMKRFFYLPFMHSEDMGDQQRCIDLCAASDDEDGVRFGKLHLDIIEAYGRFPHRNQALGRVTTPEEAKFLADGGFAG